MNDDVAGVLWLDCDYIVSLGFLW